MSTTHAAIGPISNLSRWMIGLCKIPAGAVPLAQHEEILGGLVCLLPSGCWIEWSGGAIRTLHPRDTQRGVIAVLVEQLGGSTAAMAKCLEVSARTVEGWRQAKRPLPLVAAYRIAEMLARPNLHPLPTKDTDR